MSTDVPLLLRKTGYIISRWVFSLFCVPAKRARFKSGDKRSSSPTGTGRINAALYIRCYCRPRRVKTKKIARSTQLKHGNLFLSSDIGVPNNGCPIEFSTGFCCCFSAETNRPNRFSSPSPDLVFRYILTVPVTRRIWNLRLTNDRRSKQ